MLMSKSFLMEQLVCTGELDPITLLPFQRNRVPHLSMQAGELLLHLKEQKGAVPTATIFIMPLKY